MTRLFSLILLFLITSTCSNLWARDYVVVVENGDVETDYNATDDSTTRTMADRLDVLVKELDSNLELKILSVNSLNDLDQEFAKHFTEDDQVKAIVFSGHGNETLFTLNSKKAYTGTGFAKAIESTLRHVSIKDNIMIYMASCLNACPTEGQLNFQEKMMDTLRERFEGESLRIVSLSHTESIVVHTLFGSKDLSFRQRVGRKLHKHFFKYFGRNDLSALYAGLSSALASVLLFGYLPSEPSAAAIVTSLVALPLFVGFGFGTSPGNIEVEKATIEGDQLSYEMGESGPLVRDYFEVFNQFQCHQLFGQ